MLYPVLELKMINIYWTYTLDHKIYNKNEIKFILNSRKQNDSIFLSKMSKTVDTGLYSSRKINTNYIPSYKFLIVLLLSSPKLEAKYLQSTSIYHFTSFPPRNSSAWVKLVNACPIVQKLIHTYSNVWYSLTYSSCLTRLCCWGGCWECDFCGFQSGAKVCNKVSLARVIHLCICISWW